MTEIKILMWALGLAATLGIVLYGILWKMSDDTREKVNGIASDFLSVGKIEQLIADKTEPIISRCDSIDKSISVIREDVGEVRKSVNELMRLLIKING